METEVEIRCPIGPRKLFSKLIQSGDKPIYTDDNLIEFACTDCRKLLAKRGLKYKRVMHRYNLAGELVSTKVVPFDDSSTQ